jgi:hypothetical protein
MWGGLSDFWTGLTSVWSNMFQSAEFPIGRLIATVAGISLIASVVMAVLKSRG